MPGLRVPRMQDLEDEAERSWSSHTVAKDDYVSGHFGAKVRGGWSRNAAPDGSVFPQG